MATTNENKNLSKKKSKHPLSLSLSNIAKSAEENLQNKSTDNLTKETIESKETTESEERKQTTEKEKKEIIHKEKETVMDQPPVVTYEHNEEVTVIDGTVKREYKTYFEKGLGNNFVLSTINIDKNKLNTLQILAKAEDNSSVLKLVDNIISEFFKNYKKEIKQTYKKITPPEF